MELQGSCCRGIELHIDMFVTSLIDRRRMSSSLTVHSYPLLTLQSHSFMICQHIVEKTAQIDHSVKAEFSKNDQVEIRADFCKSDHVEVRVDNRKFVRLCSNNDDDNNIDGIGGIHGSINGKCGCRSSGVRRQVMSNRGVKSRFKWNANASTTTNTTSVNDDMTTTKNDDKQGRKHDEPRPTPLAMGNTLLPAPYGVPYKDPQVGIEAGILPSGVPVPAHGLVSMHAGERVRVRVLPGRDLR